MTSKAIKCLFHVLNTERRAQKGYEALKVWKIYMACIASCLAVFILPASPVFSIPADPQSAFPESIRRQEDPDKKPDMVLFTLEQLHNGDAKFMDHAIVMNLNRYLTLMDFDGTVQRVWKDFHADWMDAVDEERLIVYANYNKGAGVIVLDEEGEISFHQELPPSQFLRIDPAICKTDDGYFVTLTQIEGTVNNGDPSGENGLYTIQLYHSEDLKEWEWIAPVYSAAFNLEDVDLWEDQGELLISYEKEQYDRGPSQICIQRSADRGRTWQEPVALLPDDCDHEPASIVAFDTVHEPASMVPLEKGWILYYSSDVNDPGRSYSGGEAFFAVFDPEWKLVEADIPVNLPVEGGILLYDTEQIGTDVYYLVSRNYPETADLILIRRRV